MTSFTCYINLAGPAASNFGETPTPVIYLNLTDTAGSFSDAWFFAANVSKREMLAVALAAINSQSQVLAWVDAPPKPLPAPSAPGPYPQCYNLYLIAT